MVQGRLRTDDDRLRLRDEVHDIDGLAQGQAQTPPLTDREEVDAGMLAHDPALGRHDGTRPDGFRP